MNSPKDYLTDRVAEFDKKWNFNGDFQNKPIFSNIRAFLTETITQSMEVGREEVKNRIIYIIEGYTTPAHPHTHSMRWLKLDSETLNEMMKVINSVNK